MTCQQALGNKEMVLEKRRHRMNGVKTENYLRWLRGMVAFFPTDVSSFIRSPSSSVTSLKTKSKAEQELK